MEEEIQPLPVDVKSKLRSGVAITSVTQCVEEMVLNAVDAGANCIAVRVDMSTYKVQVLDNGSGVTMSQLKNLGERYHTSKCHSVGDLDNLCYFGYRGEALASLKETSSILEIVSRTKSSTISYCKMFRKGKPFPVTESTVPRPSKGTTITAHDLFYNLPVRRKALNESLEFDRVRQRMEAIALVRPDISFSLRNDISGNIVLQTQKTSSILNTFSTLFGKGKAGNIKRAEIERNQFQVEAYISTDSSSRKDHQFVYVNKRLVLKTKIHKSMNWLLGKSLLLKSKTLSSNDKSESPSRQSDRYGIFVLCVTCPYDEYDITFEPAKTLIQFKKWRALRDTIEEMVLAFLRQENLLSVGQMLSLNQDENSQESLPDETRMNKDETSIGDTKERNGKVENGTTQNEITVYGNGICTSQIQNSLRSKCVTRPSKSVSEEENTKIRRFEEACPEEYNNQTASSPQESCDCESTPEGSFNFSSVSEHPLKKKSKIGVEASKTLKMSEVNNICQTPADHILNTPSEPPPRKHCKRTQESPASDDNNSDYESESPLSKTCSSRKSEAESDLIRIPTPHLGVSGKSSLSLFKETFQPKHSLSLRKRLEYLRVLTDRSKGKEDRKDDRKSHHKVVSRTDYSKTSGVRVDHSVTGVPTERGRAQDSLGCVALNSRSISSTSSVNQHSSEKSLEGCFRNEGVRKRTSLESHDDSIKRARVGQNSEENEDATNFGFDLMCHEQLLCDLSASGTKSKKQSSKGNDEGTKSTDDLMCHERLDCTVTGEEVSHNKVGVMTGNDLEDNDEDCLSTNDLICQEKFDMSVIAGAPESTSRNGCMLPQQEELGPYQPKLTSRENVPSQATQGFCMSSQGFPTNRLGYRSVSIESRESLEDNHEAEFIHHNPEVLFDKRGIGSPAGSEGFTPNMDDIDSLSPAKSCTSPQKTTTEFYNQTEAGGQLISDLTADSDKNLNKNAEEVEKDSPWIMSIDRFLDEDLDAQQTTERSSDNKDESTVWLSVTKSSSNNDGGADGSADLFQSGSVNEKAVLECLVVESETQNKHAEEMVSAEDDSGPCIACLQVKATPSAETENCDKVTSTKTSVLNNRSLTSCVQSGSIADHSGDMYSQWSDVADEEMLEAVSTVPESLQCSSNPSGDTRSKINTKAPEGNNRREGNLSAVGLEKSDKKLNNPEIDSRATSHTTEGVQSTSQKYTNQSHKSTVWLKMTSAKSGKEVYVNTLTGHTVDDPNFIPPPEPVSDDDVQPTVNGGPATLVPGQVNALSPGSHDALLQMVEGHFEDDAEMKTVKWKDGNKATSSSDSAGATSKTLEELMQEWDNPVFMLPEKEVMDMALPREKSIGAMKAQNLLNPLKFTKDMLQTYKVLGQLDNKFIACLLHCDESNKDADPSLLVLFDQHAVHERIRLEDLTSNIYKDDGGIKSWGLEGEKMISLSKECVQVMSAFNKEFKKIGILFRVSPSERESVIVQRIPECVALLETNVAKRQKSIVVWDMIETLIKEFVEMLKSTKGAACSIPQTIHKLLCSQACHGAVKFGDPLTLEECESLVQGLSLCNLPFQCAHGRPSVMPLLHVDKLHSQNERRRPNLQRIGRQISLDTGH